MATSFNVEEALKQLQSGKKLTGIDGILSPLIKQLTEAALQYCKSIKYNVFYGDGWC